MARAPKAVDDVLERLRAARPRSELAAELGLWWLSGTYPATFGASFIPVAPELVHLVNETARNAGLSS
jgi:hypothetical protein